MLPKRPPLLLSVLNPILILLFNGCRTDPTVRAVPPAEVRFCVCVLVVIILEATNNCVDTLVRANSIFVVILLAT